MIDHRFVSSAVLALAAVLCSQGARAQSATPDARLQRGLDVLDTLNRGRPQPVFEAMRREFPFLAEATASYALGDVWSRPGLDVRTRQLAATAAFAALGLRSFYKTHAAYALDAGVSPEELKEVIYMVTVPAGFPRAIEASQALQELLAERVAATATAQAPGPSDHDDPARHPHLGMWVSADGQIRHELLPDGRYDEQRGTRRSAYRGRYWVKGDRIAYLDDTGFAADGHFRDGRFFHGGHVFLRETRPR